MTDVLELPSKQARTHVKGFNYRGDLAGRWMDGARLGSVRLGSDHLIAVFHWSLRFHPIARCDVAFISCHGAGSRLFAVRARYLPPTRLVFYRTNRHLYIYIYTYFIHERENEKKKKTFPSSYNISFVC